MTGVGGVGEAGAARCARLGAIEQKLIPGTAKPKGTGCHIRLITRG